MSSGEAIEKCRSASWHWLTPRCVDALTRTLSTGGWQSWRASWNMAVVLPPAPLNAMRTGASRRSALLSSMVLPQAEADLGPGQDSLQHAAADCQRFIGEIVDVAGVGTRVEIADFKTAADL